ncbi:sensor histidine kinase [Litoribacter populi]|uniref:sensor histidine kinase n=1 Tax=Litoribacter populi TaxID=2598460 RepID=UPI00117F48AD|nr:sensor histidine kinase [Litoribacter populi]
MFSNVTVILFSFGYLALLFAIAYLTERSSFKNKKLSSNPVIYSLSLAVYCTAWTYYGSVGRAASNGLEFLTIYIGPSLIAPLWWLVMRKIIRISKVQRIASIADFISSRYGKNISLGSIVTLFCLLGIIPYISLQIKAVALSFDILQSPLAGFQENAAPFFQDTAFYLALGLALFTILFGTRNIEATAQHEGLVMTIAFESLFKLLAFLVVGVFVSYFIFDGVAEIFSQAAERGFDNLFVLQGEHGVSEWFWMSMLSMMAILFLPRQFQMGVIENTQERHLNTAMWLFPLYLLLINLFVLPIALGGLVTFGWGNVDADTFVLALPISVGQDWLAMLVYLGGFSAATSMIIVASIALSTMVSNNLVMPLLLLNHNFQKRNQHHFSNILIWSRRFSILAIILSSYIYYRIVGAQFSLVSIGLISFVAIAQLAPAILGGIYWKEGSRVGALTGILVGFVLWFYTLVVPTIISAGYLPHSIMTEGPFGLSFLIPVSLFGFKEMSYITHGLFFSLLPNFFCYLFISAISKQTSKEHNQAAVFVDIFKYSTILDSSIIWKGQAYIRDLKSLLANFLGEVKTQEAMQQYVDVSGKRVDDKIKADPEFVNYAERLLTGIIGSASARIMVASVVKEEEISMTEVLDMLKETQELKHLNEELQEKSEALRQATNSLQKMNQSLIENDKLKDEFISTVTHEMKTPITSIRAFSEILQDEDLPEEDRNRFLGIIIQETDRMTRMIDQVLDLERFDSGKQELEFQPVDLSILLLEACDSMAQVFKDRKIKLDIELDLHHSLINAHEDRVKQVILNLLSNAAKFASAEVCLRAFLVNGQVIVEVLDDGKGVPEEDIPYIFDKFYQAKNQTSKKPIGSGLGLAISKKIMDYHQGSIKMERKGNHTCFQLIFPAIENKSSHNINSENEQNTHSR